MTREEVTKNMPMLVAFSEGKTIQWLDGRKWVDTTNPSFAYDVQYRVKPESKLRPWRMEEIPIGARIRAKAHRWVAMILGHDGIERIQITNGSFSVEFALENHEHSTDCGKSWGPCGVMLSDA